MNDKPFVPSDEDSRFDLLVDGELPPDESRRLLASLDDEPGGWRRCALAFLEAQALGQELGAARHEITSTKAQPRQPASTALSWKAFSALAVCVLAAFGLGAALGGWALSSTWFGEEPSRIVKQPRKEAIRTAAFQAQDEPLGNLTLVVDGGNDALDRQVSLPVYDAQEGQKWLSFEESAIPPDVRRALERLGHRVVEQQQLVSVQLQDGRQVVVPVEQYQIVPVNRRQY